MLEFPAQAMLINASMANAGAGIHHHVYSPPLLVTEALAQFVLISKVLMQVLRLTPTRGALLALQGALREDVVALEPQQTQMQLETVQLEDLVLAARLGAKPMEHVQVLGI